MKTLSALLLFIFASILAFGQKPLTDSRTNSPYTYIYQLDDASTVLFLTGKEDDFKDEVLKEPVYKFLTGTTPDLRLPPGNYLQVHAEKNELVYRLIQKHSAYFKQLLNGIDVRFALLDSAYNEVTDALVTVGKKQIGYDDVAHAYHVRQKPQNMLIKVVYRGVSNFYLLGDKKIDDEYYFGDKKPNLWARITRPFHKKPKIQIRAADYPQGTNPGFIIFNKPKYRPNDTVKFKAFILQKGNKKPINDKQLIVRLINVDMEDSVTIGKVSAYRKGGFEYQFKLDDSLDMDLDERYRISLEPVLKIKGKPGKEDIGAKKIKRRNAALPGYMAGDFKYEEYELKANKFTARTEGSVQSPGVPVPFYFKATDDNGLNVPDGRVNIIVRSGYVNNYPEGHHFIRDTLGVFTIPLDAVGETKFVIPDSIMPRANINLSVSTQLLNSNNENRQEQHQISWNYSDRTLTIKAEGDSVLIQYMVSGRSVATAATVNENSDRKEDEPITRTITLPAKIAINPAVQSYSAKVGELTAFYSTYDISPNIGPQGYRTADSLFLQVANPRKLKFWYTVFGNKNVIAQGSGTQLNFKRPYKSTGSVSLLVNFFWGGKPRYLEQDVPYQDRVLNISIKEPVSVYPGQQAEVTAEVTDHRGKPVAGADITAYSITSKFEQYAGPAIPYLGKSYEYRKQKPFLTQSRAQVTDGELDLNWKKWARALGLDTIRYYQFTHPKDTFKIAEPTPDKVTQIAPFVMNNGQIQPVHILYINDKPVFFDQAREYPQYSFAVDSFVRSIRMRTQKHLVELRNIKVPAGKKLILSVNADTAQNKIAAIEPMPDTLTLEERNLLNSYMIKVVPNFSDRMVTLEQNGRIHLLSYNNQDMHTRPNGSPGILIGPFAQNRVDLKAMNYMDQTFFSEGGYSFEFLPGLIKQRSLPTGVYPFNIRLDRRYDENFFKQYVLSNDAIDSLWQKQMDLRVSNYFNHYSYQVSNTRLYVATGKLPQGSRIKSVLIFKKGDVDHLQILSGNNMSFYNYQPGEYQFLYLFDGNGYHIQNNIVVRANGSNYYNLGGIIPQPADSMSKRIGQILIDQVEGASVKECSEAIRESFFAKHLDRAIFNKTITGKVIDLKDRFPLAGVRVNVAGTRQSTLTDKNGVFKLQVPATGTLKATLAVYDDVRIAIRTDTATVIYMDRTPIATMREALIRGYVRRTREQTTGASTIITAREVQDKPVGNVEQLLQGKVAGLNIQNNTGAPGQRGSVNIRGLSTVDSLPGGNPLYVVDGVVADGNPLQDLKQEEIANMEILKDASATALYGTRGAYGVILVSTIKGKNKMMQDMAGGTILRRNFSDYAYWQPKLRSDADGKVRFKVTYPDDITQWRTFMVGITDNRQTGFTEGAVKAFKPVSANFTAPQFAIKGDSLATIGKLMNYTSDTIGVNRKFKYNGQLLADNKLTVKNAYIDTFKVVANTNDSLRFEYTLARPNGYADGEYRAIPVFEQGSLETKGIFKTLEKDTAINLTFDANLKEVTLRAEASALPVLLDEVQHLRNYEYLCNEQLASKLKALLTEKQIRAYLKEPFKWDNAIKDLIKRLKDNRQNQGGWGWWKDTPEELWISMHVTEALLTAKAQGYVVPIDAAGMINYLMFRSDVYRGEDKLRVIALLKMLGSSADLKLILSKYEKELPAKYLMSENEKLRLMYARQNIGMPIQMDSLLKGMKTTMFGNVYWGEPGYHLFHNSIQNSLLAYKILKMEGKHPQLLGKLRNYFLEQRGAGSWRNTYESAQILETILPDMLIGGEKPRPASLNISGSKSETVNKFPYEVKLDGNAKLSIQKSGDMPVYLTAYQKFWNPNPAKVSGDFTVDTRFDNGRTKITQAKGGEAITLTVEVTARADADRAMVEIPIPAGCSYNGKPQGYGNGEVHREYFKNKVSIFCSKLTAGKHTFTISLMPRYSGSYTVNPAKAEMMYFPVFYGREGMKKLRIE